jgi:hypothetical protein
MALCQVSASEKQIFRGNAKKILFYEVKKTDENLGMLIKNHLGLSFILTKVKIAVAKCVFVNKIFCLVYQNTLAYRDPQLSVK